MGEVVCDLGTMVSGSAAREIATRELRSEWSISKPARALRTLRRPPHRRCLCRWDLTGQAPPPPTGTAAWPSCFAASLNFRTPLWCARGLPTRRLCFSFACGPPTYGLGPLFRTLTRW